MVHTAVAAARRASPELFGGRWLFHGRRGRGPCWRMQYVDYLDYLSMGIIGHRWRMAEGGCRTGVGAPVQMAQGRVGFHSASTTRSTAYVHTYMV